MATEGGPTPAVAGGAEPSGTGPGVGPRTSLRTPFLQRRPLGVHELPAHPDLGFPSSPTSSSSSNHPALTSFLKTVFDEVRGQDWNITSWKETGTHTFKGKSKAAGVEVKQYSKELGPETWFARSSAHPDSGDTTFGILDKVLRVDHSTHEAEYTPMVFDKNTILIWNGDGNGNGKGEGACEMQEAERACGMKDVQVEVTNMYHGIPAPLNARVFSVLLVSGVSTSPPDGITAESIVVQVPVDLNTFPSNIQSRCHHKLGSSLSYHPPDSAITTENKSKVGKNLVQGEYASIEKLSRLKEGGESVWTMATASNAKGVLPMWVQKKAVPGEIVKDVEFVYEFIGRHRGELGGGGAATS